MSWLQALILGLVEALTEFVPVSSTGHLILVNRALGLRGAGVDSFSIVIQLGALMAAVIYYRSTLLGMARGLLRGEPGARRLFQSLCIGAAPALLLGYAVGKHIKALLFHPRPIAAALIVGGVVMIGMERLQRGRPRLLEDIHALRPAQALYVGLTQVFALWPGTSRSMASILGGQVAGLSTPAAADFAFLLAIPTLGAATLYDLLKNHKVLLQETGAASLAIGLLVSFLVGWLVIASFLRYLRSAGLSIFGVYRILLGAAVLWLMG